MRRTIKLRESELRNMIAESVRRVLNEGKNDFEAAKYQGKWSVFDNGSRTYSHIGVGKKKATAKAKELNDYCTQKDKEENEKKTSESINRKIDKIVSESVRRMLKESPIPNYENPVFLECNSEEDADVCVELGYSDYSSSRFYVGGCGTDAYAALAVIVEYLVENGIIDRYAYDEEDLEAYNIDDFVEVEGYYLPSWLIHIEQIVGNHGERPDSLSESIRRNVRKVLKKWTNGTYR